MTSSKRFQNSISDGPRVIIVGGGIAGIMSGIALKSKLGCNNFAIYERSNDLGGTWNLNTYPGCASDVATHWYSYSQDLNPNWSQSHILQPQLKTYWKSLAIKYAVLEHAVFFSNVVSAEWDESKQIYRVEVRNEKTGEVRVDYANAVISAAGYLDVPNQPKDLAGISDTFKGKHFHSARWDHTVDLHNKRVAVIGNGCSAAQFVPQITQDPTTQVVNFCRTPAWFLPSPHAEYSETQRNIFKYVPFALKFFRWNLSIQGELFFYLIQGTPHDHKRRLQLMKDLLGYIKAAAPAEYVEKLTPNYPAGCKRFIIDNGYLASLHRPNNDLNFDGIAEITENGILTKKGQHFDVDVIIEATGFRTDKFPFDLKGVNGLSVHDFFESQGGPTAYRATTMPGFPNFFTVLGPNSGNGHSSVIFTEEVQINYISQLLQPVLSGQASSFEVLPSASQAWNVHAQNWLSKAVWNHCRSWYRIGEEVKGKNTAIWPGSLLNQWWELRSVVWGDYKVVGGKTWKRRRVMKKVWRVVEVTAVAAAIGWAYTRPEEARGLVDQVKDQVLTQLRNVWSLVA